MTGKMNKLILVTTSFGAFIVPFMASAVNIALPSISQELQISSALLSWITLSFTLATAIFILPFGRLADIWGRKKLLLLGMSAFAIINFLCGFSTSAEMLIFFRALQGISAATIYVTVMSILTSVFPEGARGKALGLNVAMTYIGLSTGPYLGGILTDFLGWRSLFYITAIIALIVVFPLFSLKQDWAESKGEKFDFIGSIVYGIGLLGIVSGLSFINNIWGIIFIGIGILGIILFGLLENKTKNPLLNMNLFKNSRVFTFSSIAALINYSATFALTYLLSLYLQFNQGYNPSKSGLILVAQPIVMAIFSPVAGYLSDRIQPQKVATIGMGLTTLGLGFFVFLKENTNLLYIVLGLLILGLGFALFSSPNTNAIMCSVDRKYYGITSGVIGAARTVGQALSMGIASLVLVLLLGSAQISTENASQLLTAVKITFSILTVLCFLGIFASLARGKINRS